MPLPEMSELFDFGSNDPQYLRVVLYRIVENLRAVNSTMPAGASRDLLSRTTAMALAHAIKAAPLTPDEKERARSVISEAWPDP